MRPRFVLLGILAFLIYRHAAVSPPSAPVPSAGVPGAATRQGQFVKGLSTRLLIAREVAWTKYLSGAPVHDPARETEILAKLVARGRTLGLDAAFVEKVFASQLAASRQVQAELIEGWNAGAESPVGPPVELAMLRLRLDVVTDALLTCFPPAPDAGLARQTTVHLEQDGFSPAVIALAIAPLHP